jgi:hypothetical protein
MDGRSASAKAQAEYISTTGRDILRVVNAVVSRLALTTASLELVPSSFKSHPESSYSALATCAGSLGRVLGRFLQMLNRVLRPLSCCINNGWLRIADISIFLTGLTLA